MRRGWALPWAVVAVACTTYRPPSFTIKHIEQRGRIDRNGLRFVIMPDQGARLAEVAVRYDVGSSDDPEGKAGLAHLVEHLMFDLRSDGESPHPIVWYLDQLSTSWNAFTNYDSTHYMALASEAHVDSLLQIEALRLRDGCKSIAEPEFEREREVVRNEIRQRYGTPEGQIEPLLAASLYPAHHPYARMIGGDDRQIASLTLADACEFMTKYYVPERATVIVAGRVDLQATFALIQKWFGPLERRAPGEHRVVEPLVPNTTRAEFALDIDRPVVAVSWPLPATRGAAAEMVADEVRARLSQVVQSSRLYGFGARVATLEHGGRTSPVMTLLIELTGIDKLDEALQFTWKAARSYRDAVEQQTFAIPAHVKSRAKAWFISELEPLTPRAVKVGDLVQFSTDLDFLSSKLYVFHWLDAIEGVDLDGVYSAAKHILDPSKARVTVFKPSRTGVKGDTRATFAFQDATHDLGSSDVDPAEAAHPLALPVTHYAIAGATRFELDNGLRVVLLPVDSSLPVVTAQLIFDAGEASAADNPQLPSAIPRFGIASDETRRKTWRSGIQLACRETPDHEMCAAQGIGIYLPEMVEILERKFKAAEFDMKQIEAWQREATAAARRRQQVARDELERQELTAMFGADHPYTRGAIRSLGTEMAVDRDKLLAFRDGHFRAANATLVVAGTFDRANAEALIRSAFGNWPRGQARPDAPSAPPRTGPTFVGVVRDEGPQMEVVIEYPSPPGIGGQQAARLVVAEMLAVSASRVRQQLGASYGTTGHRDERRSSSRYVVHGSIDASRAGEGLATLREGIEAVRHGDDFDTTFVKARRKVARRLLDESAASLDLATRLGTIARFGLPPDYYDKLVQQVANVSPTQVRAVIEAELAPGGEAVIATADRATLEAAFKAAGIADYKLVEPAYGK